MGKVDSRRILYPDMGARRLTLNWAVSEPGHEFPQHIHDASDDTFLVLQGQVDVRQGKSRLPLLAGQAAFIPALQLHGTITTGSGTAILISFQCPPDWALYTGERDSSRPGAPQPKGLITPGAVKLVPFADQNGFFTSPAMGSQCVAAAHRNLGPGEHFITRSTADGEAFLFVWQGGISVQALSQTYAAAERETVFMQGVEEAEVTNTTGAETIVIEVHAPPAL